MRTGADDVVGVIDAVGRAELLSAQTRHRAGRAIGSGGRPGESVSGAGRIFILHANHDAKGADAMGLRLGIASRRSQIRHALKARPEERARAAKLIERVADHLAGAIDVVAGVRGRRIDLPRRRG